MIHIGSPSLTSTAYDTVDDSYRDNNQVSHSREISDSWVIESTAGIMSLVTLAGLIVLLATCDGQSSFDWHGVTINTLVAILATTSRISLSVALAGSIGQWKWILFTRSERKMYDFELIDQASRGVFGCAALVGRLSPSLVNIGALAMLLSIAFDPFAQQLVQSRATLVYVNDSQTLLPIATRYSGGVMFGPDDGDTVVYTCGSLGDGPPVVQRAQADFGIQSAVLSGLAMSNATEVMQQLPWKCSSGNCTWDPVESLAICNRCTDIRHMTTSFPTMQQQALDYVGGPSYEGNSTVLSLPNGAWIENVDNVTRLGLGPGDAIGSWMITYGTGNPPDTVTFQEAETLIWAMTMLRVRNETQNDQASWPNMSLDAMECGLYYCVNTYTSNVTNGILYEKEEPSPNANRNPASWMPEGSLATRMTKAQLESIQFVDCVSSYQRTDLMLGDSFNISWSAVNTINAYMNSTFIDDMNDDMQSPIDPKVELKSNGYYITPYGQGTDAWSPPAMQPLLAATDLNATFAAVARSMTNSIRSNGQVTPLQGRNGSLVILVDVRWPWIILPVLVVLTGLVQLAVSILATRKTRAPVWRNSSLPAISRIFEASCALSGGKHLSGMERAAKDTRIDLFAASDPETKRSLDKCNNDSGVLESRGSTSIDGFAYLPDNRDPASSLWSSNRQGEVQENGLVYTSDPTPILGRNWHVRGLKHGQMADRREV